MITRFWPLSVLRDSPLMSPHYAWEVGQFYRRAPSQGAYYACVDVARRTPGLEAYNLVVIETTEAPNRRMYKDYPRSDEWLRLERTIMAETEDGYMLLIMDALH